MNTVNLQASINNLTQVDRVQQAEHRAPMANQVQNAAVAAEEAQQRVNTPVQPDQVEGKVIDPKDERREKRARQGKKERSRGNKPKHDPPSKTGYFIDLNA
jgi:hypothetical protein